MRFHAKPTPVLCVESDESDCARVVVHDLNRNVASMSVLAFLATCTIGRNTVVLTDRTTPVPSLTP